eukprot:Nk52_evm72s2118 gene=Nk52_evmTU72s2118
MAVDDPAEKVTAPVQSLVEANIAAAKQEIQKDLMGGVAFEKPIKESVSEMTIVNAQSPSTAAGANGDSADTSMTQFELPEGWTVEETDTGRLYFVDHSKKLTSWVPPEGSVGFHESMPELQPLPVGWEMALDDDGERYYIDHNSKTTSREDPRGSIASSRASLVNALSGSKLDVAVETEDSASATCANEAPTSLFAPPKKKGSLSELEFLSPENLPPPIAYLNQKRRMEEEKEKRKSSLEALNQSAENIKAGVDSNATDSITSAENKVNFKDAKIVKVYLENGQTKTFKFFDSTTAKDLIKLATQRTYSLPYSDHLALVMEHTETKMWAWLRPFDSLYERMKFMDERCVHSNWIHRLRVRYLKPTPLEFHTDNTSTFDYMFHQTKNDVISGEFCTELVKDDLIHLAALDMQLWCCTSSKEFDVKMIKNSIGFEFFFPSYFLQTYYIKNRKKTEKSLAAMWKSKCQFLTATDCKLKYLDICYKLRDFGGEKYHVLLELETGVVNPVKLLISCKHGISYVKEDASICKVMNFADISKMEMNVDATNQKCIVELFKFPDSSTSIKIIAKDNDGQDIATLINGYHRLFVMSPHAADDKYLIPAPAPKVLELGTKEDSSDTICDGLADAPPPPPMPAGLIGLHDLQGVKLRKVLKHASSEPAMDSANTSLEMIKKAKERMKRVGTMDSIKTKSGEVFEFKRLRNTNTSKPAPAYDSTHNVLNIGYRKGSDGSLVCDLDMKPPKYVASSLENIKLRNTGIDLTVAPESNIRPSKRSSEPSISTTKQIPPPVKPRVKRSETMPAIRITPSSPSTPRSSLAEEVLEEHAPEMGDAFSEGLANKLMLGDAPFQSTPPKAPGNSEALKDPIEGEQCANFTPPVVDLNLPKEIVAEAEIAPKTAKEGVRSREGLLNNEVDLDNTHEYYDILETSMDAKSRTTGVDKDTTVSTESVDKLDGSESKSKAKTGGGGGKKSRKRKGKKK